VRAAPAAVALAVLLAVGGCGGGGGGSGSSAASSVSWDSKPLVVRQPELPDDTIVSGRIRNNSQRTVSFEAADVTVVAGDGAEVRSAARFQTGVTHSLYPPRETPQEANPRFEAERLGQAATVKPGKAVPFVVSWRVPHGGEPPERVELGAGASLKLP
jgi:hypothetical protein